MLCQICNSAPASIHIQEFVNGERRSLHLCPECARKRNMGDSPLQDPHLQEMLEHLSKAVISDPDGVLSKLFGEQEEAPQEKEPQANIVCEECGTDTAKYRKTGLFGCEHCYEAFARILDEELPLTHRAGVHRGRMPAEDTPILENKEISERLNMRRQLEQLRSKLDESIRREEYELAAELRDEITGIEKKLASMEPEGNQSDIDHEPSK